MSIINTIENSFNKLKKHKPEKDKMSVKQKRLMKNQVETLAKLHDTSSNIA